MASRKNLIEFEEIEKISLLLDILVDCEEYDDFDATLIRVENVDITCIKNPTEENINKKIECIRNKNPEKVNDYFEIILNSKYIRRILQQNKENVQRKGVDLLFQKLGEALIKTIPTRPIKQEETEDKKEKNGVEINRVRIIFLNEISTVSQGHLAIGYAETALLELRELNEDWLPQNNRDKPIRHPYELYALFNKGLTLAHDHIDTEGAIRTFSEIIESFGKKDSAKLRDAFKDEYGEKNADKFFSIFFWLIYVPTKYQLTEAYSDLNSSHDREQVIEKLFHRFKNLSKKYQVSGDSNLTKKIEAYYKAKFIIQYMFSKIDSGIIYKRPKKMQDSLKNTCLSAFDEYWGKNERNESLNELLKKSLGIIKDKDFINGHPVIKNRLISVEALYLLENAKSTEKADKRKEALTKVFNICTEQIANEDHDSSDWSDFAVTFLESTIFSLENDKEKVDWLERLDTDQNNTYQNIFQQIKKRAWIPRKRELVEKFMKCQEKILQQYETGKEENKKERNKYLKYQIELIEKILSDEGGRVFKKPWTNYEKEKLVKTLKKTIDNGKLTDWVKTEEKHFSFESDDEKSEFKKVVKFLEDEITNNDYNLPQDNDLKPVAELIKNKMNCDFYTRKLRLNTEKFYDHLIYQSCRPSLEDHYVLTVLRRWQSFTPALSSGSEVGQKGGGYFVYKTNGKGEIKEGLVVDPGFNFLENFFGEGFSIRDINAILITHSHRDHSSDFMSIITLVHEMNKCGERVFTDGKWKKRKLVLFMTEGCHQTFAEQLNGSEEEFCDIIRVNQNDKEVYGKNAFLNHFKLTATKANHDDLTDYDSVGYVICDKKDNPLIGFTGDTQWYYSIEEKYEDCPVICMNIGGVIDIFKKPELKLSDLCEKEDKEHINNIKTILLRENHLYLPGFYLMAKELANKKKPKLLIISELCEEMKGGLRTDLAKKISEALSETLSGKLNKTSVLPEDIGLTVILDKRKKGHVFCKVCQAAHSPKKITPVETDKDNAIVYLCDKHYDELKEGYYLPKINELELDENELRKPLIKKGRTGFSKRFRAI